VDDFVVEVLTLGPATTLLLIGFAFMACVGVIRQVFAAELYRSNSRQAF
jgi:hypothetical protein